MAEFWQKRVNDAQLLALLGCINSTLQLHSRGHLSNTLNNIRSHHNGVLLVEDTGWQDFKDAREDGLQLGSLLLMLLDLQGGQQVSRKGMYHC